MSTVISAPRDVAIASAGGATLRGWYWPVAEPRGVLVIAHGFGEHGGCYGHVARTLGPALGLDVLSADQRGHGRSPGRRGVVAHYDELVGDIEAALEWTARERPGVPRYLLGHSNGGLLALRMVLERGADSAPAGLILSNPALQIVTPIPRAKLAIGRLLLRYAPGVTLSGKIDAARLTRDPASQSDHRTDPLRHSRINAPLYFGMADAGSRVIASAADVTLPVLMLLGGADPVIDAEASRRAFERMASADKTLKLYPPMLHEPLNELGREEVFADIESWLIARLPPAALGSPGAVRAPGV